MLRYVSKEIRRAEREYMNIWGVGVYSHIHIYEYTPRPPIIASSYGPGPKLNE
jgi:hypothetical protein